MTRRLFTKLWRDLGTAWPRMMLMVLAMTVTLIVFSGVLYTRGVLAREMARAYLGTSPASATLLLERGLDAGELAAIAGEASRQPGILAATARTQLTLQVQQLGGGWGPNPLQLFVIAPDDPLQIESFTVELGQWPPAPGEILLNRYSFELLNAEVGDVVVVQAPSGQTISLRISGSVYIPALAPSFQEQKAHGFIAITSLPLLGVPDTLDALKVQVADQPGLNTPSRDRDAIVAAALDLAAWLQPAYGVTVRDIQIPTPYAHPHQAQADSLLLALLAFGGAGLVLSAVLVATMLNGLLTQHVPQIGIMKAIGASSSRVLQFYLLLILVIAGTATALALLPGLLMSRAFAPAILELLGVDAVSVAPPGWMVAVVVVAGLGMPLLFCLATIFNTSRTTVRQALDERGVAPPGDLPSRFDAGLSRLPGLDRTILMAFRNLFRRRARMALSVGLLASAGTVFVAGVSTMAGFQASLERDQAQRRWDVELTLAGINQDSVSSLSAVTEQVSGVTRVEDWTMLQTSLIPPEQQTSVTRTYPDQGHGSLAVTVIPPDTRLFDPPALLAGRWLQSNETGVVVIGQSALTADLPSIQTGNVIQLLLDGRLTTWTVVGICETQGHAGGLFITQAGLAAQTGVTQPNLLRVVTERHDEATRAAVAQAAEVVLTEAGVVVRSAASVSRSAAAGAGHMLPLILVFLGLSVAVAVVGLAGLASTMSTNVLERTREFGVMSAIGAQPAIVRRLVVLEGVFIALASCVVAMTFAPPLTAIMLNALPVPGLFQISLPGLLLWVVAVLVGAALATLAPAAQAARLTVREALAYL